MWSRWPGTLCYVCACVMTSAWTNPTCKWHFSLKEDFFSFLKLLLKNLVCRDDWPMFGSTSIAHVPVRSHHTFTQLPLSEKIPKDSNQETVNSSKLIESSLQWKLLPSCHINYRYLSQAPRSLLVISLSTHVRSLQLLSMLLLLLATTILVSSNRKPVQPVGAIKTVSDITEESLIH